MNIQKYQSKNTLSLRRHVLGLYNIIAFYIARSISCISRSHFEFQSKQYSYFIHPYNSTWKNERAIEVPIIYTELLSSRDSDVLEIGNVLSHYFPVSHKVLDKYETSDYPHLIREGILEFDTTKKFDYIYSISTIEHVGYDDCPILQDGYLLALRKIQYLLSNNGKAVVTIPLGYNRYFDEAIRTNKINLEHVTYMKKISAENEWKEASLADAIGVQYGEPFPAANCIIILTLFKDSSL